jgi:hypothetical protein
MKKRLQFAHGGRYVAVERMTFPGQVSIHRSSHRSGQLCTHYRTLAEDRHSALLSLRLPLMSAAIAQILQTVRIRHRYEAIPNVGPRGRGAAG